MCVHDAAHSVQKTRKKRMGPHHVIPVLQRVMSAGTVGTRVFSFALKNHSSKSFRRNSVRHQSYDIFMALG